MSRLAQFCLALVVLASLVFAPAVVTAQSTGKIVVVGVPDRFKGNKEATTGLTDVPVGTRVVMKPVAWSGTGQKYSDALLTVTSATWTLTGPATSTATIQDTSGGTSLNGLVTYFIPDTIGTYIVTMTATTASGTATQATDTIRAAKFVGAGWSLVYPATGVPATCGCHGTNPTVFTDWQNTNHARAVRRKMNNLDFNDVPLTTAGHFGSSCMSCHSAGGNKASAFSSDPNGGYAEYASKLKFTVPPNHPGVFDSLVTVANSGASSTTDSLKILMALTGIQCENCHGPAGEHVKQYSTPGNTKMDKSFSSDVCAPCHFSGDRHGKGYSWASSKHANSLAEGASGQYMDRSGCNSCHTAQGYVNQTIHGNPEPVVPAGQVIWDNPQPITCQACHDPHNGNNAAQLRRTSIAEACTGCHTVRFSTYSGLHHAHQGPMLIGADGTPMSAAIPLSGTSSATGWEFPGYKYANSSHSQISERCVVCHMANSPDYDPTYASPDTLLNKLGGHTFKIVYLLPDSTEMLNDVGCRECHGTVSMEFVNQSQAKIDTLLAQLAAALPKRDSANTTPVYPMDPTRYAAWKNAPTAVKLKLTTTESAASYNYYFVLNDGSEGVHNHEYAKELLQSSIEQLSLGSGAVSAISVTDRPNDNGRYVRVSWQPFPAEKASYGAVAQYFVFKRVLNAGTAPSAKVNSFADMIGQAAPGKLFKMNDYTSWVSYGPYAPTGTILSADVPTDADSAAYTAVYVAGFSNGMLTKYMSPVDSFYSVANLVPNAPSGLVASAGPNGILLKWNQPDVMPDSRGLVAFTYSVYRSTTTGFSVSGLTPIAANIKDVQYTDNSVTGGHTYYYKVVAQQVQSSMKSGASSEAAATTTDVNETGGIPTEFALGQNYPNPFNPSTEIRFGLPTEEHVRITIYTMSGVEVKTLVNGTMSAGNFSVRWDGTSAFGEHVSSGVYLYRIQAGSFSSVKKMVMLK